jgi:hypothetical protein
MTRENAARIPLPSRRVLLKAAAAGGVFAVPFIASFSMDAASAQTTRLPPGVSNQPMTSNMVCSNQPIIVSNQPPGVSNQQPPGVSNQPTSVPTAAFHAELRRIRRSGVPGGPVAGTAMFEFMRRGDDLAYELHVEGRLRRFIVRAAGGEDLIVDTTSRKTGKIPEASLACGPYPLNVLYSAFAVGGSTVEVDLNDGVLFGTIVASFGPFGLADLG